MFSPIKDFIELIKWAFGYAWGTVTSNTTIAQGGFNYAEGSGLNAVISTVYKITYPIGIAIMLLSWGFSIAKSTISTSLDIKDKNSLIRSITSLVIGIVAVMAAPKLLTVLTSISSWLCSEIYLNVTAMESINAFIESGADSMERLYGAGFNQIVSIFREGGVENNILYSVIVLFIVELVFMLNILWIALLQCISPLFISFFGNDSTRKLALNFIKEYFKALLVAPITLIYFALAISVVSNMSLVLGLIGSLVLGISTVSIAGKKLDKLIN